MILTCPSCNKRYRVDSSKIGSTGCTVRCVSCEHIWQQDGSPIEEAVLAPESEKRVPAFSKKAVFKKSSLSQTSFFMLVGLLFFATSFFCFRHTLVGIVPQLAPLYQMINISTLSPKDLSFEGVHMTPMESTSEKSLFVISGFATNKSDRLIHAPTLRIHALGNCKQATWFKRLDAWIKGHKRCSLNDWPLTLKDNTLFPGEKIEFSSFPLLVPENMDRFETRFD
ncbi:MAG: hypothetical protein GY915_04225 [bacterium]|nr:hypothetical protein [bacterium]